MGFGIVIRRSDVDVRPLSSGSVPVVYLPPGHAIDTVALLA
jgi:hypothetical protein